MNTRNTFSGVKSPMHADNKFDPFSFLYTVPILLTAKKRGCIFNQAEK